MTRHFKSAAAQWRRGNKVQANFHLAFARLPRLDGPDDAFRVFFAERCAATISVAGSPTTILAGRGRPVAPIEGRGEPRPETGAAGRRRP